MSLAIGDIRPLAIREAYIESLLQWAAKKCSQEVNYGNLKVMIGCKAEGKLNRGGIMTGDVISL